MTKLEPNKISKYRQKLLDAIDRELQQLRSQSLDAAAAVYLAREKPPERLIPSWDAIVKVGNRPQIKLSEKVSIIKVCDRLQGKFLILGNSGSGKTTTLLELARCLLIRAKKSPKEPLPILLNLAAKTPNYLHLASRLINRLKQQYKIPSEVGNYWLENKLLLPLLDGFDEVNSDRQEECLQEINRLIENFQPQNVVVCSSLAAYKKCRTKLKLNAAVMLRPITKNKIKEYTFARRSRELWYNIAEEPELLKLAKIPLFLSMMTLAYEEILIESWRRIPSEEERKRYVLNAYVRRQLGRESGDRFYAKNKQPLPEETKRWLSWLGARMEEKEEREFKVNRLDESWLITREEKKIYRLVVKVLSAVIFALIFGSIVGVIFGLMWGAIAVFIGIIIGWFFAFPGVKKLMLRVTLFSSGNIPWNYRRFLDYAAQKLLLQKVGDRYQFIHKILQQHFAREN